MKYEFETFGADAFSDGLNGQYLDFAFDFVFSFEVIEVFASDHNEALLLPLLVIEFVYLGCEVYFF